MKTFDSHAHYNSEKFLADINRRNELLDELFDNSVEYILNASCDIDDSEASLKLAESYNGMYAAVGIHPHETERYPYESKNEVLDRMAELMKHPKAVAVGEIGLDYHYDFSPRENQIFWFENQLSLAKDLGAPYIIHDREAHGATMDIIKKSGYTNGVFHCYSGSAEMAAELLKMGFYISFTGVITYKNANGVLKALESVPLDRLLIETDCPYLAPVPYRSKTNNSGYMIETAKKMAEVKGVSLEEVIEATKNNAKQFFGIA